MKILEFLISNYDIIITLGVAILTVLVTIARLTPTKTDDKIVDVLKRGFDLFKTNVKVENLTEIKDLIEKK